MAEQELHGSGGYVIADISDELAKKTRDSRPIDIKKSGDKTTITFHPVLKTAKNLKAAIFRLITTSVNLKKKIGETLK